MDVTQIIFAFVGGALLTAALYWLAQQALNRFFRQRNLSARTRIARETLSMAIDQRSAFRIEVKSGDFKGYKAEGTCAQLTESWIALDMGNAFSASQWEGENVIVFFQTSFKRKTSYFQFTGKIFSAHKKGGSTFLRMAAPDHLDPGQKRSFLRITPHKESILAMALWPLLDTQPLPTSTQKLGPALFNYRLGRAETLILSNLSAGGMRLGLDVTIAAEQVMELDKGSQLLFLLIVKPMEEGKKPLALWLACSIASVSKPDNGFRYLGMRFINWAFVEPEQKEISWFPINKDKSVASLANWVMRRHMEQTKML